MRRQSLAGVDPLRRVRVQRRLQRAVTDAALSTLHANEDGHVYRRAFLASRSRHTASDGLDTVHAAFVAELARIPTRAPSRFAASGKLAGLGTLVCFAWLFVVFAPEHWLDPTKLPIARGAFATGGRPDPGTSDVQQLFGSALPEFVVALDMFASAPPTDRGTAGKHLDDVISRLEAEASKALGSDAMSFLRVMVHESRALVEAADASGLDAFMRSTDLFNAALEREALGYYLDAEVVPRGGGARVYLASFAVERVRWFKAGTMRVRVLHLARRDSLNFVHNLLGFTRPQIRDALVLLERVDAWLIDTLLPALAPDGRYELARPHPRVQRLENLDSLSLRLGREVRRQIASKVKDCAALEDTGALFMRRKQAFQGMSERAVRAGMQMIVPSTYDFEVARFKSVSQIAFAEYRELGHVRAFLDDEQHRACFRALSATLVESIDRHEIQHRLDYVSGALERLPLELARRVGSLEKLGGRNVLAKRALAETSAYLSEVARGHDLVKLNLGVLAGHALEPSTWGSPEYYAALVIFEGLARELRLPDEAPGRKPTERVSEQLGILLTLEDREVSRAAYRLWQSLMGEALPDLIEVKAD